MSAEIAVLRSSLVEFRAILQHKLQIACAAEICLERCEAVHPDLSGLHQMEAHVRSLRQLHHANTDLIFAADAALRALVAGSRSSSPM